MTVYVSLLRGINVSAGTAVPMPALAALCRDLGLSDATTLLRSGNVVFSSDDSAHAIARRLEDAVESRFGFRPAVILRSAAQLRAIVARNPLARRAEDDPARTLVMFLAGPPSATAAADLAVTHRGREEVRISGSEAYLYYPDGIGRSKLTNALLERALGVAGTARNWNTVTRLLALAES